MNRRERLQERYEDALFALLMDEIAAMEEKEAEEENGRLNSDPSAAVPEDVDRRCLQTIRRGFGKQRAHAAGRFTVKAMKGAMMAAGIAALLFTGAFATSEGVRVNTINLVVEVFEGGKTFHFDDPTQESAAPVETVPAPEVAPSEDHESDPSDESEGESIISNVVIDETEAGIKAESVHAELFFRGNICYRDESLHFWDDEGHYVYPLSCNGTVYIPLWTAAKWMAADGAWDREQMTAALTHNGGEPAFLRRYEQERPYSKEWGEQLDRDFENGVTAELRRDLTVTVDGQVETLTNTQGEPVYPLVFRDNVYLPLRSVARLCGLDVLWIHYPEGEVSFENVTYSSLGDNITLFPPMQAEGLAAERRYLDQFYDYADQVQTKLDAMAAMDVEAMAPETRNAVVKDLYQFLNHIYGLASPGNGHLNDIYRIENCFRDTITGILYYAVDYDETRDLPSWNPLLRWDDILESAAKGLEGLRSRLEMSEIGYAALAAHVASQAQ